MIGVNVSCVEYSPAKTEGKSSDFSHFFKTACLAKNLKDNKHNNLNNYLAQKYAQIFVLRNYLFLKATIIFFDLHVWSQKLCTSWNRKCCQAYFCAKWRQLSAYFYKSCSILTIILFFTLKYIIKNWLSGVFLSQKPLKIRGEFWCVKPFCWSENAMVACPSVDQTTLGDNIIFDFVIPRRKNF